MCAMWTAMISLIHQCCRIEQLLPVFYAFTSFYQHPLFFTPSLNCSLTIVLPLVLKLNKTKSFWPPVSKAKVRTDLCSIFRLSCSWCTVWLCLSRVVALYWLQLKIFLSWDISTQSFKHSPFNTKLNVLIHLFLIFGTQMHTLSLLFSVLSVMQWHSVSLCVLRFFRHAWAIN